MLTEGNFTRDKWTNLLHLFNVSHFSTTCCAKNSRLISCSTVAKRIQIHKEEARVVSKSRQAVMNMSSLIATKFFRRIESDCIWTSGDAGSFGETRQQDECWTKLVRRSVDVSSAIQVHSGETRRIKQKKIQKTRTILWLKPGFTNENLFPKTIKLWGNPLHTEPVLQLTSKVKKYGNDMGPLPPNIAGHIALHGCRLLHGQEDLWKTTRQSNGHIWMWIWLFGQWSWIPLFEQQFISEKTMTRNVVKNYLWKTTGQLFVWAWLMSPTSLLHSRAYQCATAKVYVFSDSVLCLGKNGKQSLWILEEANPPVFGQQLF